MISTNWTLNAIHFARLRFWLYELLHDKVSDLSQTEKELDLILTDLKKEKKLSSETVDSLRALVLDDFFAWGPLTHLFDDPELEMVRVHDSYHLEYSLYGDQICAFPVNIMPATHRRIIAYVEQQIGHELTSENAIGIALWNNKILVEAAYKSPREKVFILRREDPGCGFSKWMTIKEQDIAFQSLLRKCRFSLQNLPEGFVEKCRMRVPALRKFFSDGACDQDETREEYVERMLKLHLDASERTDSLFLEFLRNYFLGLGPLEWILAQKDFSSVTVRGDNSIVYRLKSQSSAEPDFVCPVLFQDHSSIQNVIERICTPDGFRIDEKQPLLAYQSKDGFKVQIGVPPVLNEIFLRISKSD